MRNTIGIIEGEGIGPEIMHAALSSLEQCMHVANVEFDYIRYRGPAPSTDRDFDDSHASLHDFYSEIKNKAGVILRSSLYASHVYKLREEFNLLYKLIFLDPIPELSDVSPLKREISQRINLVLVRENSQGMYHCSEALQVTELGERIVKLTSCYEENKIRQVANVAFQLASQSRSKLKLLIKGDVLRQLAGLWLEVFEDVHRRFPSIEFDWDHPDPALSDMFIRPEKFDVMVALDIDADIISDFVSGLLYGTRAITPSGNFDPTGTFATYQTIHGSADSLAQTNKANPIGMIMAAAMALEFSFQMKREAQLIRTAIRNVLAQGYRTADIYNSCVSAQRLIGTIEMEERIVSSIQRPRSEHALD